MLLVVGLWSAPAAAGRVHVEVSPATAARLNARLVRRLVALELRDVVVAPPEGVSEPDHSLFFRVLWLARRRAYRLQLWELGVQHGGRLVRSAGKAPLLDARRLALAAATLARRLRWHRQAELRAVAARREEAARRAARDAARQEPARVALAPGLRGGAFLGVGWLLGPSAAAQLRLRGGARLDLEAAWMHGGLAEPDPMPRANWYELRLSPSYEATGQLAGQRLRWHLGLSFAAAVVHLTRVTAVDAIPGQSQSWSTRAGVMGGVEASLAQHWFLEFEPELALALRRLPYQDAGGGARQLGGVWLGARLSLVYDGAVR